MREDEREWHERRLLLFYIWTRVCLCIAYSLLTHGTFFAPYGFSSFSYFSSVARRRFSCLVPNKYFLYNAFASGTISSAAFFVIFVLFVGRWFVCCTFSLNVDLERRPSSVYTSLRTSLSHTLTRKPFTIGVRFAAPLISSVD